MTEQSQDLASAVRLLTEKLARLEQRVALLERSSAPVAEFDAVEEESPGRDSRTPAQSASGGAFSTLLLLFGRLLLVLGGGFLLRTFTEAGMLGALPGVALGLAYAAVWIALADRAGRKGRRLDAAFHGVGAALVAFPLIVETTIRFGVLDHRIAAALLFAGSVLGLGAAWRGRSRATAWIYSTAPVLAAVVLIFAGKSLLPYAWLLLALGPVTIMTAYARGWRFVPWPVAGAANLVVLFSLQLAGTGGTPEGAIPAPTPGQAQTVALALLVLYAGLFSATILLGRRRVGAFETVQSAAAIVLGLGGAVRMAAMTGRGEWILGVVAVVAAGVSYTLAFLFVDRRSEDRKNFYYFAWLGPAFLVSASLIMAEGHLLALLWVALALACGVVGSRYNRFTLRLQSALYALLAAIQGGVVSHGWQAFVGSARDAVSPVAIITLVVCAGLVVDYIVLGIGRRTDDPRRRILPHLTTAGLAVLGLGAAILKLAGGPLAGPAESVDAAMVAVMRTVVIALAIIALVVATKRWGRPEFLWISFPLILFGAAKLLFEDLPRGRPATVTVGLVAYGLALLLASRFRRPAAASP